MKKILFFIATCFCGFSHGEEVIGYYEALMMSQKQFYENKETISQWNVFFERTNNLQNLDEQGQCYSKGGNEILIVLKILEDGEVGEVYASHDNRKSRCFSGIYRGKRLPKPPFSPTYKLMRFM